ncbi:MAG: DUF748 domain-containing protein [Burkholderiales bacterium]|nr:DUF748 domain-containing protein [Burkholderiales bacterium]
MSDGAAASAIRTPRSRWLRRFAWVAGILALLILAAWLAVPPILRAQLESRLTEALGRKTTVESVAFNPFTLRVTIRGLSIADAAGPRPLLAFDELDADLSTASIVHRAPVLDALKIVRPSVSLSRDPQGRYNVSDLIDRATSGPDGPPPRFSLNNIEVEDGTVTFADAVAGREHKLTSLVLGIPFLSSLPYQTEIRVTPRAEGSLNGSQVALGGSTVPFADPPEASLDLDLDALPLREYLAYLPAKPRVDLAGGALTTKLKLVFVGGRGAAQRLDLRGDARIDGLAVKRRDGSSLVAADRIAISLDAVDLVRHEARVASVAIDAPTIDLKRLADGTLELAQPLFEAPARATPASRVSEPAKSAEKPWTVTLAKATVARGSLGLADESSGFRSSLVDVSVDATNLSTKAGEKAHVALAFVSGDRIATFKGEADVEPTVPAASGRFELAKFSLGLLFPYYKDVLAVEVQKGSLALATTFAYGADGNLRLSDGTATVDDLRLAFPGAREPLWRVPQLRGTGLDVDVAARRVSIGTIAGSGAVLRIARERDGTLEAARIMKTTHATGTADSDDRTWTLLVRQTSIERVTADLEDRVPNPPVKLAARDLSFSIGDYSNARGAKSELTLRTRLGDRGRLAFEGPVVTNPFSISGRLEASGLNLVSIRPYVESQVNVSVTGGRFAAKGDLSVETRENAPAKASWKGNVTVTEFAALDKPTASDLARWKSLAIEGLDVTTSPFRTSIERIVAADFYARVIVYPDGTLNLTRLLTPGAEPEPAPDAKPASVAAAEPREDTPVSIGRIELSGGNVNFSDQFVRPNYSANLTDVAGTIGAMSPEKAGEVAIAARVDQAAPVEVRGTLQPFARELALDLTGKARDVDLPPLSPYAIKYAGYGIEKGKLSFDVHYKIEDRKLAAENQLVLDQLVFNRERVDSPTATKLPVLLAVSLLKDRNGVIDIRLPISGSLDDPKFSVGGLIVQVIVNLITKAITAPFALLSAAFGGGEELSTIPFTAGSAAFGPEAQKRVDTLSRALADRPGLKLDIGGRADPAGDREALRRASVENAMKRAKLKSLASEGNAPASVDAVAIGADERVRWLTAAYREAPIKERPRNVIGMLKDVAPAEMEAMLLANATVDDEALRQLAHARAQAVKDALVAKGVAGERLFLLAPKLGGETVGPGGRAAAPPGAPLPPARVDLALR